jgi:hypothetical protein
LRTYSGLSDVFGCEVTVRRTIPSPTAQHVAVVFENGCGATTPLNTQVSIAPSGTPFSPKSSPASLVVHGQHDLQVNWVADDVIEIFLPANEQTYRKEMGQAGVTIRYR